MALFEKPMKFWFQKCPWFWKSINIWPRYGPLNVGYLISKSTFWPSQVWYLKKVEKLGGGINLKVVWEAMFDLNLNKYWDHMQKFRVKLQKLSKILGFENYWNLRFCPTWFTIINITRSILRIQGLFFCHGFHGLIFWPRLS